MICLGEKYLKDPTQLRKRKAYVSLLLQEGRSTDSPSSQEWVSSEFYQGHRDLLEEEIKEINAALRKIARKSK